MAYTHLPDSLLTERLILRRPTDRDLAAIFRIHSDPMTNQFNPFGPITEQDQAIEIYATWSQYWTSVGYGPWTITLQQEPERIIGFGGLSPKKILGLNTLNLYYRFDPTAWGQGYAVEMGQKALYCAFHILQHAHIHAIIRPTNTPSIRVAQRLGMQQFATLDDVPGQVPSLVFELRAEQWAGR